MDSNPVAVTWGEMTYTFSKILEKYRWLSFFSGNAGREPVTLLKNDLVYKFFAYFEWRYYAYLHGCFLCHLDVRGRCSDFFDYITFLKIPYAGVYFQKLCNLKVFKISRDSLEQQYSKWGYQENFKPIYFLYEKILSVKKNSKPNCKTYNFYPLRSFCAREKILSLLSFTRLFLFC